LAFGLHDEHEATMDTTFMEPYRGRAALRATDSMPARRARARPLDDVASCHRVVVLAPSARSVPWDPKRIETQPGEAHW